MIGGDGALGPFTAAGTALASPRSGHASAVIGNALYVMGGLTGAGISRVIERAPIGANGSLGPFAPVSATALSADRSGHAIAVVRDTLYLIGGLGAVGPLASAEHASLNVDSALAPFATSDIALVLPRIHDTAIAIRDAVYVIGRSGDTNSIERASLLPDGSLTAFATVAGNALVTRRSSHAIARIAHYLYVIGGSAPDTIANIERATINTDGSLGQFTAVSVSLNQPRFGPTCVVIGNFLFAIGGIGLDHSRLTSVERAVINSDGTLGSFDIVPGVTLTTGRNYFTTLGVKTQIGRTLLPEDDTPPGASPVAVISHGFWTRQFAADPNIIGQKMQINGSPFTTFPDASNPLTGTPEQYASARKRKA